MAQGEQSLSPGGATRSPAGAGPSSIPAAVSTRWNRSTLRSVPIQHFISCRYSSRRYRRRRKWYDMGEYVTCIALSVTGTCPTESRVMAPSRRFLGMLTLLVAVGACDRPEEARLSQPPAEPTTTAESQPLEEWLLGTLGSRRQWSSNAVKISLNNPNLATTITSPNRKLVRVHAWDHNENDYNTAMVRLDEGDVLYAITNAEFEELHARALAGKMP